MPTKLDDLQAKRCFTASGWLFKDGKVLLVKHKMLGIWLAPGGHVEENELPHHTAEREFFEETGVKVHAVGELPIKEDNLTQDLPLPFIYNLHWINKPGESKKNPHSGRICQQHFMFGFYVEADGSLEINELDRGVDAVKWFSEDQIDDLDTIDRIKLEAHHVFAHHPSR